MGDLLLKLRNTPVVDTLYRRARDVLHGPGWGGFHRDRIYRALMLDLLDAFPFTSFVETGTYRGHSTELVARHRPALPVYTVEVVEPTHARARRALARYANVTTILGSSDDAVRRLIADNRAGPMPLYYLDAHWQTYWPLRDELRAIAAAGGKAVIVIDDFQVPGQPQFGFDIDGGGDRTAGQPCNFDYVHPALGPPHDYRALFPRYTMADGFPTRPGALRGHVVLFQNMPADHETFAARPLARQHYFASLIA